MATSKLMLASFLDSDNNALPIRTENVVDVTRKKTLA